MKNINNSEEKQRWKRRRECLFKPSNFKV